MEKNEKLKRHAKHKSVDVPKRLGILIIPAGLLLIFLLAFCVLFPDFWYIAFCKYLKEVMLHGGFLITMLINILWISNAFININKSLFKSYDNGGAPEENGYMGIRHPLLKPLNKDSSSGDYSFIFFELTVRFLLLVGLEISICYVFFSNRLSEILALTLPMVTIFIVCSCFIVGRNEKLIFETEKQVEQDMAKDNIATTIQNMDFPIRIYNREIGKFFISIGVKKIMVGSMEATLTRLEVNLKNFKIKLMPTSKLKSDYEIFLVSENDLNFWEDVKDGENVKLILVYTFYSKLHKEESEVSLVVNVSTSNNQLDIL